jgi:membrane-associated HD superfamily phosphohydrolase
MSLVQVDESELATLKAAYDLQNKLYTGKNKRGYEKLLKEEFGERVQTTDDIADQYTAPLKKELDELREWKKSLEEKEQDNHLKQTFESLKNTRGYTDEGIGQIQKIMLEKKIADAEAAADHWEKKNPAKPAESNGFGESGWNFTDEISQENSDAANWFANPDRMFDKVARETIDSIKQSKR